MLKFPEKSSYFAAKIEQIRKRKPINIKKNVFIFDNHCDSGVCALLVLMVVIQNPKGGGLSSNFPSSSQLMGVQKTGDFLGEGTWVLLTITLMVLSLAINVAVKGGTEKSSRPSVKRTD